MQKFIQYIQEGYKTKGASIRLGGAALNGKTIDELPITIPLSTFNRHGLIAGATGTGKTKTLQVLAEECSKNGIPVLMMDLKGDLSGLSMPGTQNEVVSMRQGLVGETYQAQGFPLEFLSLSKQKGVKLRATVSEFGPILFSQILDLNDTQTGVMALIFKYCDDQQLPLVDLKDIKKTIQYLSEHKDDPVIQEYGGFAKSSSIAIVRKIVELEQQGANEFFGEPSFEVNDLLQIKNGQGVISMLKLEDLQDKPKLFSTFMLCLLAEVYATFEELGDVEKPKLVIFIDEAHLLFKNASKALMNQLEMIIKLIRSKGVGIFFCTQNPNDIPAIVLSQLGLKIQHALRAFSAKDRKAIKLVAENYPESEYYDTAELITSLGIGEALVTALSEKGKPTPLAHVVLRAPSSRMGTITGPEMNTILAESNLIDKYQTKLDKQSAYEILEVKMQQASTKWTPTIIHTSSTNRTPTTKQNPPGRPRDSATTKIAKSLGNTIVREITRGLLGVLGIRRRKR